MFSKVRLVAIYAVSGFFLLVDRVLKWQALYSWKRPRLTVNWFGWDPFLNEGIAFGIPLPWWVVIGLTAAILLLVAYRLRQLTREMRRETKKKYEFIGLLLVLVGAISNMMDRVLYGVTVDYLRIFTGVINLADVLIVAGFLLYLISIADNTNALGRHE